MKNSGTHLGHRESAMPELGYFATKPLWPRWMAVWHIVQSVIRFCSGSSPRNYEDTQGVVDLAKYAIVVDI